MIPRNQSWFDSPSTGSGQAARHDRHAEQRRRITAYTLLRMAI